MSAFDRFKQLFTDEQNTQDSIHNHDNLLRPLFYMLVVAFAIILIVLVIDFAFGLNDSSKLGPFGDFFGGMLNPIFTFLTFFGLIVTIVMQRIELRLTREEYEKTSAALNTQAIENTFFNAVALHHKIVEGLRFDPSVFPESELCKTRRLAGLQNQPLPVSHGRQVFDAVILEIRNRSSTPDEAQQQYAFLQKQHNHVLGHYFRNLYQVLKVIDGYTENELTKDDKHKYSSILRAQLSSNELVLLFLNCLEGMVDQGQFRNLVVRYKILGHVPIRQKGPIYTATDRDVPIATEETITQYLLESAVLQKINVTGRGAFGSNPVKLPSDT